MLFSVSGGCCLLVDFLALGGSISHTALFWA
jgi:hypothetical protein